MARPLRVAMRARKPSLRLRLIFEGWYVRFMLSVSFDYVGNRGVTVQVGLDSAETQNP